MQTECLNSRYVFDAALPVSRLVAAVGDSIHGNGCVCDVDVLARFVKQGKS